MAASLARKVSGLLRPLSASLCARTPKPCLFSVLAPARPRLGPGPGSGSGPGSGLSAPALGAPLRAVAGQTRRSDLLQRVSALIPSVTQQPTRTLTYYSVKKGKRKSVKSVTDRFMRLHCGLWIRRKAGHKKKLWKKKPDRKKRLREHVFCTKTQCKLLDKMTTSFWKRRNWFVDDPYQKYHERVNLKV